MNGRPVQGGGDSVCPAVVISGSPDAPASDSVSIGTRQLASEVYETTLPSGTRILSERMDSVRSAAVGFWFRSGSAHEPEAQAGITHLLEHMVFKGTDRRSARQLALAIEGLGGSLDAYTSHEHTSFLVRVPEGGLETAVDVLSDLCFHPRLDEADLELEREVVLEEVARVEDTPDDLVFELHGAFLFDGHPYGAPILGKPATVSSICREDLVRQHQVGFQPSRLVVAGAGLLEHDRLVELVAARLPDVAGSAPPDLAPPDSWGTGHRTEKRPGGSQAHLVAGAPGVPWGDPLRDATIVVGTALGGGMTSRLFQRIREELGLAYSVFSWQSFYRRGGALGAYVGTRPETLDRAREVLFAELALLAERGLAPDEDAETRTQLRGQLLLALESPASRMHRLASTALSDEPYRPLDEISRRIEALTTEQIAEACRLLRPEALAVLELVPA
ncbi:MAG: insulinase family protein [marine benthic group bacterium]|jgi:predicted Zn-dependent peptidase|nr:insulinase family protein [Gemmatimonadota bacterium]MCL7968415.1 insulinase family protein [Gemmatimonadota bacterium]